MPKAVTAYFMQHVVYDQTMRCANFIVKKPMVIGHECAGIIEEVGSEVKSLEVGDRVALEPGISCGHCSLCKAGSYNLCPEMRFFGSPPTNGSLAHKVNDQMFSAPQTRIFLISHAVYVHKNCK